MRAATCDSCLLDTCDSCLLDTLEPEGLRGHPLKGFRGHTRKGFGDHRLKGPGAKAAKCELKWKVLGDKCKLGVRCCGETVAGDRDGGAPAGERGREGDGGV